MQVSQIGKQEDGGVTRLSFSKEERQVKDLVMTFMQEAQLAIREDEAGNLIGRREGQRPDAPVIMIGSHLDSVPNGGNFDGPLGVLAGIEVLQAMNEQGIETENPLEVIAFTDEEGTRFGFGMIGSRALAGTLTQNHLTAKDKNGVSISQAMQEAGLNPSKITSAARAKDSIKAYLELHIEQGKVLENQNLAVGVVTGIAGPLWTSWTLRGEAAHAGATPMTMRKDPLVAAANIFEVIEEEVKKYDQAVGTVGKISVKPGGVNVIPGEAEFTLDLRDIDEAIRDQIESNIHTRATHICQDRGIELTIEDLQRVTPAPCSPEIQAIIKESCGKLGLETISLPSGAGHDGMQLVNTCPIGMIFVRSKNGVSHNPAEWSSPEDCFKGTQVLYHSVLELAQSKI